MLTLIFHMFDIYIKGSFWPISAIGYMARFDTDSVKTPKSKYVSILIRLYKIPELIKSIT
jgi:hypothetical protein